MRSAKGHHEEEEEEDDEFGPKKEGPSNSKEPKSNDQKASATRSKHSVTEQRRRIKINERFQILRDLIPHSDQKRDTASFLLEVIDYVQYLQEKVQKYEGSHQSWSAEPTKLMPWRNSHWRAQSLVGHPQAMNGSVPVPIVSGKFEENNNINPAMLANAQNSVEFNPSTDASCQPVDQQPEITNKAIAMPSTLQPNLPATVQTETVLANSLQRPVSDAQPTEGPISSNTLSQQEELMIEGGTISISSIYSQGLLNTLTEALQSAGVDLSQASISVQVDLNKRPNRGLTTPGASIGRDQANRTTTNQAAKNFEDAGSVDSDQARKRLKT